MAAAEKAKKAAERKAASEAKKALNRERRDLEKQRKGSPKKRGTRGGSKTVCKGCDEPRKSSKAWYSCQCKEDISLCSNCFDKYEEADPDELQCQSCEESFIQTKT